MDLKSLNIDQLKAKVYDSLVVVENHQQFIKLLNQELASRSTQTVNNIKEEKDETKQEN